MNITKTISTLLLGSLFCSYAQADLNFEKLLNKLQNPMTQEEYNFLINKTSNEIFQDIKFRKAISTINKLESLNDNDFLVIGDVIEKLSQHSNDKLIFELSNRLQELRDLQAEDAKREFRTTTRLTREVKVVDLTYDQIEGLELTGSKFPDKTILLTFDDGPHGYRTQKIMDALDKYKIPATFFTIGSSLNGTLKDFDKNSVKGLEIAQDIIERGHTLATHTWNHPALGKTSVASGKANVDKAVKFVIENLEYFPHYFRYPYGSRNSSVLKYMNQHDYSLDVTSGDSNMQGIKSIYWHMDSNDWKTKNPTTLVKNCLKIFNTYKRGVFLMHDIHNQTEVAFPILLDKLVEDGWTFVRLVN